MACLKFQLLVFIMIFISVTFGEETYPQLLFSNGTSIGLLDTKTGDVDILIDGYSYILFMDYHFAKNYIFWSDFTEGTISRLSYPAEVKTAPETIISADKITGVAVDIINDHLYWSDYGSHQIGRSDLDGSNTKVILAVTKPLDLEIDATNGLLYVLTNFTEVLKCRLDGSECYAIFETSNFTGADNIAIDFEDNRIYWTFNERNIPIYSSFLNGSNIMAIGDSVDSAFGLDVSCTHIYYAVWNYGISRSEKSNSTSDILIFSNYPTMTVKIFKTQGVCSSYKSLRSAHKRSSDYILDFSEDNVISDHELEMNWYRIISDSGDMMPTSAPGSMHCGTVNPIWLNGNMPSYDDGNVTGEACLQTKYDICEYIINIEIKRCCGFYLYYLQPSPVNSSFCFGDSPVSCPDGMFSATGFYPGCKYKFPPEIVPVKVDAELLEGQSLQIPVHGNQSYFSLLPVFRCKFIDVSEGSYVYDVHWYINGIFVISHLNIPFSNINSTVLRDTDWISRFRMNMEVKCAIRMRYSTDSEPGLHLYSQPYQAGIFPAKYEYTVNEGESIDIPFTSSVPVGCISSHDAIRTNCEQNFYIFQLMNDQKSISYRNNIAKRDIVFEAQFCGISIKSLHWKKEQKIRVYGVSDSMYNFKDRSTVLKISTSAVSELNDIWRDVQVPDIKVTIIDKDNLLIDRQCRSYNDPHITTFDGRSYHYMNVGEFVMYKNDKGPYSVHALFTNCGFGWIGSSCHCGIAVRSRNSLFVLRTCQTISRTEKNLLQEPFTKLISCDDNDLLIEHDTNNYKITLPIGTEIKFSITRWSKFIQMIAIKLSLFDINEAKGLCGVPSATKDMSDDFTHGQHGPIDNDQAFADSWRISPTMLNEQLFGNEPMFLSNTDEGKGYNVTENNFTRYFTCERQASSTVSLDEVNTGQCNLTERTEFCSAFPRTENETITSFYTSCSISKRKKRSVKSDDRISGDDDVFDFPSLTYDESVFNTDVTIPETFRNGWTENTAWQTCMEEIQNALPSKFTNLVDVPVQEFVESCVLDIKLVGDTTFLTDTIGTMLTFIMSEILRNESLYILNTTDGSQALIEYVTSFLCPSNCSANGNCTMGVCLCNRKYIGDDCSQSITIPPSNISLPSDGLCTLGTRGCRSTNIFGNFLSRTVWYKLKHFQITTDSINYISESDVFQANFRNMFMVSVDLMSSRRKRTTSLTIMAEGYEISLSYDSKNFGESVNIILYNESSYSCYSKSVACFELDLWNSTVVPITKNDNNKFPVAKAATLGGFLLIIIAVIGFIYYKMKSNNPRTKINAIPGKLEGRPRVYLDQNIESQIWMTRDKTLSDMQLEIDDSRGETPFELFEKQLPPRSHYKLNLEN